MCPLSCLCLHFTARCTEPVELLIPKLAQQVWFPTVACGEQEHPVSASGNKNRVTMKCWFGLSPSRTIKSKCISCFDPHCNPHLCSANTITANKAYWIILTVCGSGEERGRDRKWQGGWKVEREIEKQERGSETEKRRVKHRVGGRGGGVSEKREKVTETGKLLFPPC